MTVLRVCFVGDSITNGTSDPAYLGWAGRLCATEHDAGHDLSCYNLGIRADTSRHIAARWQAECRARLPNGVPGALVFAFGINDTAVEVGVGIRVPVEESVANARTIIGAAKAWLPTLWIGPTPADEGQQPFRSTPDIAYAFSNPRIAALNRRLATVAGELEVPYLDLFAGLDGDPG